jgi:hypothetical protein
VALDAVRIKVGDRFFGQVRKVGFGCGDRGVGCAELVAFGGFDSAVGAERVKRGALNSLGVLLA